MGNDQSINTKNTKDENKININLSSSSALLIHKMYNMIQNDDICKMKEFLQSNQMEQYSNKAFVLRIAMNYIAGYHVIYDVQSKGKGRTIQQLQCILQLLIHAGGNLSQEMEHNQKEEEKEVEEEYNPNHWSCLHYACASGNWDLIPFLLSKQCRITRDKFGLLPQHVIPRKFRSTIETTSITTKHPSIKTLENETMKLSFHNHYQLNIMSSNMTRTDTMMMTQEYGSPIYISYDVSNENDYNDGYIQMIYHSGKKDMISSNVEIEYGAYFRLPLNQKKGTLCFPTHHLMDDLVLRFLYILTDKNMMTRKVVASTNPILLKTGISQYIFTVGGMSFYHTNESLNNKNFKTRQELEEYIQKIKSLSKNHNSLESNNENLSSFIPSEQQQQQQQQQQEQEEEQEEEQQQQQPESIIPTTCLSNPIQINTK